MSPFPFLPRYVGGEAGHEGSRGKLRAEGSQVGRGQLSLSAVGSAPASGRTRLLRQAGRGSLWVSSIPRALMPSVQGPVALSRLWDVPCQTCRVVPATGRSAHSRQPRKTLGTGIWWQLWACACPALAEFLQPGPGQALLSTPPPASCGPSGMRCHCSVTWSQTKPASAGALGFWAGPSRAWQGRGTSCSFLCVSSSKTHRPRSTSWAPGRGLAPPRAL